MNNKKHDSRRGLSIIKDEPRKRADCCSGEEGAGVAMKEAIALLPGRALHGPAARQQCTSVS